MPFTLIRRFPRNISSRLLLGFFRETQAQKTKQPGHLSGKEGDPVPAGLPYHSANFLNRSSLREGEVDLLFSVRKPAGTGVSSLPERWRT